MPDTVSTVALHPWNTEFRWRDRTRPFSTLGAEQVAQFDELGFVVVPDLLGADLVARVRDEIDGFEREMNASISRSKHTESIHLHLLKLVEIADWH